MSNRPIAVLGAEIPSSSATFVYREVKALRELGVAVRCFSMRAHSGDGLSADAYPYLTETEVVYDRRPVRRAFSALRHFAGNAGSSMRALRALFRDLRRGEFRQPGQRAKLVYQFFAAMGLARKLKIRGIRHLHVHFANTPSNVGMYAAIAAGIPFSVTAHANDLWVQGSLLREKISRSFLFRTISESNRRRLVEEIGDIANRVEVIRCGVDVEEYFVKEEAPQSEGAPRILFVGRLVAKKGADILIKAIHRLKSTTPGIHLDIVGSGPERMQLEQICNTLGLEETVTFHGFKNSKTIRTMMKRAHAFVLPCREAKDGDRDGIPVVLMEAMAVGTPVVSTNLEGLDEILIPGQTGLVVPPDDPDATTAAIRALISQRSLCETLASGALQIVQERFNLARNAARLQHSMGIRDFSEPVATAPVSEKDSGILVITPFRDEIRHLGRVIDCMTAQTVKPDCWILVDDGSSDEGPDLVRAAAREHPWITLLQLKDRGERILGAGVITAFDAGKASYTEDYTYIVKLDADLSFGARYLESALRTLQENKNLACVSGKVYRPTGGGPVEEFMIDDMVAGQFKFYRKRAFDEIGGFVRGLLWDGIDYHRCRQLGWKTASMELPALRICHHRLMGSSDRNIWRGRLRLGRGQWFMGTHPLYLFASAFLRLLEKPYVVGGALIVAGYFRSMLTGVPRYDDPYFRAELRSWQLSRLARVLKHGEVR